VIMIGALAHLLLTRQPLTASRQTVTGVWTIASRRVGCCVISSTLGTDASFATLVPEVETLNYEEWKDVPARLKHLTRDEEVPGVDVCLECAGDCLLCVILLLIDR